MNSKTSASQHRIGFFDAIFGCMLWGISGNFAELLFDHYHFHALWVVAVRLLLAGTIILVWCFFVIDHAEIKRFFHWKNLLQAVCFTFFGMVPSQLTYFCAIQYGNASTATVLQFMGPLFIVLYLSIRQMQLPRRIDVISILIAIIGTFLLVTDGQLDKLTLGPLAILFGLLAAVSQASYTLLPRQLLEEFDARLVTGVSMLIGGVAFSPLLFVFKMPTFNLTTLTGMGYIVIFGTMFAYLFYLKSLQYISPTLTGMLSAFEPLTATIIAVIWMHLHLGMVEIIGSLLILSTAFLQGMAAQKATK